MENQLLFFDQLKSPFSVANPWDSIRDRRIVNDEGDKISEWAVPIASFVDFLARRK